MKCWKCAKELDAGTNFCLFCGSNQSRSAAITDVGIAMRTLYDRYGANAIFTNNAYLVNGLGDLTENSKKLRNHIKIGLDSGLGRLYLEQLQAGKPDDAFDLRVKILLTEDAGLNEKTAEEIAGCFDEMIGWRSHSQSPAKASTGGQSVPYPEQDRISQTNETDRFKQRSESVAEIDRSRKTITGDKAINHAQLGDNKTKLSPYAYEIVTLICIVVSLVVGSIINQTNDPNYFFDYVLYAIMLIPLLVSLGTKKQNVNCGTAVLSIVVTIVILLMIVFMGGECISKIKRVNMLSEKTDATSREMYLWQMHLLIEDAIFLFSSIPLAIRMLCHRNAEKKKRTCKGNQI